MTAVFQPRFKQDGDPLNGQIASLMRRRMEAGEWKAGSRSSADILDSLPDRDAGYIERLNKLLKRGSPGFPPSIRPPPSGAA